MAASFPTSVKNFGADRVDGDYIPAADANDLRAEVVALENALIGGWLAIAASLTFGSASAPNFVINTPSDLTGQISVGMKIRLTQTTVKYFIVVAITATTMTVYGGTDYTLLNVAITSPAFSYMKAPAGFPLARAKWTVLVTDTTVRVQLNPAASTWYNLGGLSITIPIGAWIVSWSCIGTTILSAAGVASLFVSLSTSNNAESDAGWTQKINSNAIASISSSLARMRDLTLAAAAIYYIITKTNAATGTEIDNNNDQQTLRLEALCAYL